MRWGTLWIVAAFSSVSAENGGPSSTSIPAQSQLATCAWQRINHVTQRLPQVCYTSTWAPSPRASTTVSPTSTTTTVEPQSSDNDRHEPKETNANTEQNGTASETDSESPLDHANFLSFEDWRRENLAKAGQSVDGLRQKEQGERKRPDGLHNALDSLGEEGEIEIDFGGFAKPDVLSSTSAIAHTLIPSQDALEGSPARKRPKDAGRTCKERTNYASYDCAATNLKTNPETRSPSAILVENKDSYMLNICSASNKFFIVELCDNILIDTIVLANFEFFSSMLRNFRVSVSDRYPVKLDQWKDLGTYEARNSREIQAFLVENPLIWARYLRIELLSHYGNEYYCPLSLLRVHGTTMMEEFNNDMKSAANEEEDAPRRTAEDVPTLSVAAPSSSSRFLLSAPPSTCPAKPPTAVMSSSEPPSPASTQSTIISSTVSTSSIEIMDTITSVTETASATTQPPTATPSTQESFFKSMHKRLQHLETNSTLSLRYIEEQSQILRDAFSKVEKRQMGKTTAFLESLNATVLRELLDFRAQYDEIWQSTIVELSSQRQQSQHDVVALTHRLGLLADDIVLQKRLTILQFLLIFLCLGLVIFTKHGSSSNNLEKTPHLAQYASYLESPPLSPAPPNSINRYGTFNPFAHQQNPSADSDKFIGTSPVKEYSPPTPESQASDVEDASVVSPSSPLTHDPPEPEPLPRPSSAPGTRSLTPTRLDLGADDKTTLG